VPVALAILIFVLCLILWQADFVFASGILAWGFVIAVLLLWGFGVLPLAGHYDVATSTIHVQIQIMQPGQNELPATFPAQEPAP
jgi:hypothetical protein